MSENTYNLTHYKSLGKIIRTMAGQGKEDRQFADLRRSEDEAKRRLKIGKYREQMTGGTNGQPSTGQQTICTKLSPPFKELPQKTCVEDFLPYPVPTEEHPLVD